jgi:hypothetical protein
MKIQIVTSIMLLVTPIIGIVHEAEAASPADTAKASLANYIKAWHEPDAKMRKALLNTAWAEKGTYTDPSAHVDGRDALVAHIDRFLSNPQFKGYSIVRTSEIDFHHQVFRFEWEMKDSSGNTVTAGMDYGEFNEDGVVTKIVGFFGPFPELK